MGGKWFHPLGNISNNIGYVNLKNVLGKHSQQQVIELDFGNRKKKLKTIKKALNNITNHLNTFKQLRPRTFTWKNPNLHTSDTDIRGFVGQEVKATDSYWTSEQALDTYSSKGKDEDGNDLGRDMSDADLIPANESGEHISITSRLGKKDAMYVSVINQLITKIETLEAKVTALEG